MHVFERHKRIALHSHLQHFSLDLADLFSLHNNFHFGDSSSSMPENDDRIFYAVAVDLATCNTIPGHNSLICWFNTEHNSLPPELDALI